MSHRNSAPVTIAKSQLALVPALADVIKRDARQVAQIQTVILVLVLVLLITNGGAG